VTTHLRDARSLLFVPGNRPERYAKAAASGADTVCIDLEDAVPPVERAAARTAVLAFIAAQDAGHAVGVRINSLTRADGLRDVLALTDAGANANATPAFVMIAKTESAEQVTLVAAQLPGVPLIALIESARGLQAAAAIAQAHPQLQALMFGGADYAAELGCAFAWEPLLHARASLVTAAAAAGLAAIDVPWLDVADAAGAGGETQRVADLGYTGKALIHPSQVQPVHAAFAPTPEALAWAQRVVQATTLDGAALLLDGRLVDRPVVLAAQRLLRRARA
jgi:(S)-citramalyl-CoA lyase